MLAPATPLPDVDGVQHSYVDAGGLVVHAASAGPPDGDPIVALHGFPQHWYLWRGVIGPLTDAGYRVICPDLRGAGWTQATRRGYEKEQLATDLLALLDALGLERVKLIGHDWGGWTGFLACMRAPERFERFLAANIAPPWPRAGAALLGAWRFAYQWLIASPWLGRRAVQSGWIVRTMLRHGTVDRGALSDADVEAYCAPLRERARALAGQQLYRTFVLRETPALLRGRYRGVRLGVPTRLVFGTADAAISVRLLDGWQDHADDMSVELVDGAGHFIVDERPDLIADRALELFA